MINTFQPTHTTEHLSWIVYLPRGIERLKNLGTLKRVPGKYLLAQAGTVTKYCYVVLSGRVVSYECSLDGEERIYSVNEENSILLDENLLFGYPVSVNVKTITNCELICIDRTALRKAILEDPETALDIMQSMSLKYLSTVEQMRCMNEETALQKVCRLFMTYAERHGIQEGNKVIIHEKINQEYISNLLGINRITVVRVVKQLKESNLIGKQNGYYYLCDMKKFRDYAAQKR